MHSFTVGLLQEERHNTASKSAFHQFNTGMSFRRAAPEDDWTRIKDMPPYLQLRRADRPPAAMVSFHEANVAKRRLELPTLQVEPRRTYNQGSSSWPSALQWGHDWTVPGRCRPSHFLRHDGMALPW